jgi:glycosyltransferase involved in cell wall biosynthesis
MHEISLTIAICTFNRAIFLDNCLAHLLPQLNAFDNVKVLVIDNKSTDDTRKIVEKYQRITDCVSYTFCREQGLSFARNHGLKYSGSRWLSFLDDDAFPDKNWLKVNCNIIYQGKYDAWGGVYLPWFRDGKKTWFKDEYETNSTKMPKSTRRLLPSDPYFSGGNCTFNRQKLLSVGGFPIGLGMNGIKVAYGEEVLAQRNLASEGGVLGFSPELIIHHYTPIKKQSVFWVWQRSFIIGRDFWDIYGKNVTRKNVIFYLRLRGKIAFNITRSSFKSFFSRQESHDLRNVLYELNTWSYIFGLIVGVCKKFKV